MVDRELKVSVRQSRLETGIWCNECELSSSEAIRITAVSEQGVSELGVIVVCRECKTVSSG